MKPINRLIKGLKFGLVLLLLIFFFKTDVAYARGGCFAVGTDILTPDGNKHIEQLQSSDRVIGFNFNTHQLEEETVGEIQIIHSPDYYLINNNIRVTGTHPFYVDRNSEIDLIEVKDLSLGDRLIQTDGSYLTVASIDYIQEPITVYNLLAITPDHNFFANGVLVHNKGGGGGGGGGGSGGSGGYRGGHVNSHYSVPINQKTLPSIILVCATTVLVLLPLSFSREILNSIRFRGKAFTDSLELIEFTKAIHPQFTNAYSVQYSEDDEIWVSAPASAELNKNIYQHLVSKTELIEQTRQLFIQYQNDWSRKNFAHMAEYVSQPYYEKQHKVFVDSFGQNFDIVYPLEACEVVPLSYQENEERSAFVVQINARIINFEISPEGYVFRGKAYPRSFTEYWYIEVNNAKRFYLAGISQTNPVA